VPRQVTHITVEQPFELRLCLLGHGWIALAPHEFDEVNERWHTVLRLGPKVVDAKIQLADQQRLRVQLKARSRLSAHELGAARAQLRHMMRLDEDLSEFYAMCAPDPRRRWIARRGAGRLLRSASVFEDLMKLLFTTNTTWASTEHMTQNLVEALGSKAPSGKRAFPTAKQCLRDEDFYRDVVRCGYRAGAAVALADAFATGALTNATFLTAQPSEELWQRLCSLRGFGPYAAGQAMRLCGHYDRLAIDSWCRATLQTLEGRTRPPADKVIERRYAKMAPYQGLLLWCDLTASWHAPESRDADDD